MIKAHIINVSEYPNVWLTSDLHFGHGNIIKYCDRPYESVEEMNEDLVVKCNEKVGDDDLVINLGDVGFLKKDKIEFYLSRLKGHKMLLLGNHDNREHVEGLFDKGVYDYAEISRGSAVYVLCHFPILSWNGKYHGIPHLHGHTHGTLDNTGELRFDMGIDVWKGLISLDYMTDFIKKNKTKILAKEHPEGNLDVHFKQLYERAIKDSQETTIPELLEKLK